LVAAAVVGRHLGGGEQEDLAHHHPLAGILLEHPPDAPQQLVGTRIVVQRAGRDRLYGIGQVGEGWVLSDAVDHVHAKAVDAAIEPEAQRVVHGLHHLRLVPVEIGLLAQEEMQVPLARGLVPGPGGIRAEGGAPVVGRNVRGTVAPDVPAALGRIAPGTRLAKPRVLVTRVVGNPVDQHPQPALVGLGQQAVEVAKRAEERVDVAEIRHVVAVVLHR
jgi:hypothetical protein